MARRKLEQVADGSVRFGAIVMVITLNAEQAKTVTRYTGKKISELELTAQDLNLVTGVRGRLKW